jgi:hypothetical protein
MLNIAQCSDREKVLYASGCLTGPAADWWDSYVAAHDAADTITWAEFATQFRNYHIPARLMKIKKKEFLSLKQGSMSVSEYHDKFIQLSRYAPYEVAEDERKQEHFIEGLNGPLQYALVAHTFPSFQRLLDKALAIEHKRVQLGDLKRKVISQGQGSSSVRPRYVPPQGTPTRPGGGPRPAQYTPQGSPRTPPTRPGHSGYPKNSGQVVRVIKISGFGKSYPKSRRVLQYPKIRVPDNSGSGIGYSRSTRI